MKTFFYEAHFSPSLFQQVTANAKNFQDAMRTSIEAFGGKLIRCQFKFEGSDPIGFVAFPSQVHASAWNTFYQRQDGVVSSKIIRLMEDADLEKLGSLVDECASKA